MQKADLPIWVRPFEVIVVSNRTALIEVVEDALSIHTIKSRGGYTSLAEFFFAKFIRVSDPWIMTHSRCLKGSSSVHQYQVTGWKREDDNVVPYSSWFPVFRPSFVVFPLLVRCKFCIMPTIWRCGWISYWPCVILSLGHFECWKQCAINAHHEETG